MSQNNRYLMYIFLHILLPFSVVIVFYSVRLHLWNQFGGHKSPGDDTERK